MIDNKEKDLEKIKELMINSKPEVLTDEQKEFVSYLDKFKERFGRNAYIAEPSGTMQDTIRAIQICLKKR